ncbi:MAG: LPS assembly protein LptD [Gammaproteobacteria bacterium]|nr:LPS assembly protein LptD [Gammaproteobacteria bacterium]
MYVKTSHPILLAAGLLMAHTAVGAPMWDCRADTDGKWQCVEKMPELEGQLAHGDSEDPGAPRHYPSQTEATSQSAGTEYEAQSANSLRKPEEHTREYTSSPPASAARYTEKKDAAPRDNTRHHEEAVNSEPAASPPITTSGLSEPSKLPDDPPATTAEKPSPDPDDAQIVEKPKTIEDFTAVESDQKTDSSQPHALVEFAPSVESAQSVELAAPGEIAPAPAEPASATAAVEEIEAEPPATRRGTKPSDETTSVETLAGLADPAIAPGEGANIERGLQWESCQLATQPVPLTFEPVAIDQTVIDADSADLDAEEQTVNLSGTVVARRGSRMVEADNAYYDHGGDTLDVEGNVYFEQTGLRLSASEAHIDLAARQAELKDVEYRLVEVSGRGTAETAKIESADLSRYEKINYTTCRPAKEDWLIEAGDLEVNQETGVGKAKDAKFRFKGVPFAYLPYASFPIDDRRKSGFLVPILGVDERSGYEIATPYYINISPQMDATITPRLMTDRGIMLGGEYRYLSENNSGEVRAEVMPDDRKVSDDANSTRGAFSYQGRGAPFGKWRYDANINYVSDNQFLEDFGNNLSFTSTRNIERRGDIIYDGQGWTFLGRLQYFQTVDELISSEGRPYSRMPQLLFDLDRPNQAYGLDYQMRAEYVYFNHSDGNTVRGSRVDLMPSVSLPLTRPWGFLTPKASLRYTAYALSEQSPGLSSSPDRSIGTFSVDSGLFFERQSNWLGQSSTHTLEPRLFYLLTPEVDQDELPIFDTSTVDFSFASLFRENRFSGVDRVGDANQLTAALTSRTFDNENGQELFRASIGQIYHFRDREVRLLPGQDPITESSSPFVAELSARLSPHWRTTGNIQWDPHESDNGLEKASASIHYRDARRRIFNLSYRFTDDLVDQTDVSARWPITSNVHGVGRWTYSLLHEETMMAFAGFEYDTCCWAARIIGQQLLTNINDPPQNSLFVQVELKGLTSIGNKLDDFLEEGILGYHTY